MQKITQNVYAETKFGGCNPGFVVTSGGVVMSDTPQIPTDALKWREAIAKFGPVRYIVNNEPHGDHITGNYFFKGAVISHEGTRQAILKYSSAEAGERYKTTSPADYTLMKRFKYRLPTITVTDEMTIYLGNHTIRIMHLPGHTPYQLAVFVPEEKVLFTADNVLYKFPVYLQHAEPFAWIESLKKMAKLDVEFIIPGHGEVCIAAYLPEMITRVQEWIDAVNVLIKKGMTLAEVEKNFTFRDRYAPQPGREATASIVVKANITRLYEVLKNKQK
jgi:cyclase